MSPTRTLRTRASWLYTLLITALIAAIFGVTLGITGAAAAVTDSPIVRPDCLTPLATPKLVLNTFGTTTPLRAKTPLTVTLPDELKATTAVIATVRAASRTATPIRAGTDPARDLPVISLGTSAPHRAQVTTLLPVENGTITLQADTSANVAVTILGSVDTSDSCANLMTETALDTRTGVGTDPGAIGVGESRRVALVKTDALPDALHSTLTSLTIYGGSGHSTVDLVIDGITIKSYDVPAGQVVNAFEVIPPTASGGFRLGVTEGSVNVAATPVAWMADASVLNGEKIRLGTSTSAADANPRGLKLMLPERARDAVGAFIALNAQSKATTTATMRLRASGTTSAGQPIFTATTNRRQLRGLAFVRPGADGSVILTVGGAESYTASIVGWSSRILPNTPADNVTVAPSADVSVVSNDPTTSDPNVISYAGAEKLQPGDVVTSTPSDTDNDGLLVKVTSVVKNTTTAASRFRPALLAALDAGDQVANVEPASLDELLPSAEFDQSGLVDSGAYQQLDPLPQLPPDEPPPAPNADGTPGGSPNALRAASTVNGGTFGNPVFSCGGGVKGTLGAGIQIYGDAHVSASWGRWFSSPSADFGFTGGIKGDVHASVSGKASCSGNQTFRGPNLPSFRTMVGPVPVWITPELSLNVSAHGTVESSINASAGFNAQVNAGVRYANGSFSPYRTASLTFPASIDAHAGANLRLDVTPRITFRIQSLAGPYLEVDAFAELKVNLGQNPWWTVDAGVSAAVGMDIDLKIKRLTYKAGSITLWNRRVAQAPGGYNGPTGGGGTPGGGTTGGYYDRALTASGGRAPYSWYRVSGNLPPGISLRTDGHLVGVPQAAGTWTIVVRVIDANGNRVAADQNVTMSFGNPVAPPPDRTVSVAKVGNAQGRPGCSSSACAYLQVSFANFGGGAHTVVCRASNDPAWYTYTTSATTTASCYYGYPGQTVWATVDGVLSNKIRW